MTAHSKLPRARAMSVAALCLLMSLPCWAGPLSADDARERLREAADGNLSALADATAVLPAPWPLLAQARQAAAQLHERQAISLAEAFIAQRGGGTCDTALAQRVIADAAFAAADYARAAAAAQASLHVLERCPADRDAVEGSQTLATLAAALASAPPQRVQQFTPAPTAFARDKVGLPRASVFINGRAQESVLDTGANLSVISASAAQRLGLQIGDEAAVGSSSRRTVATRVAIADRLQLAGLDLRNVVFLVLDDAQLDMPVPGGYHIDAIIGFPVLRAMGRIRFGGDGQLQPQPGAGAADLPRNLALAGSDLFVDARVGGIEVPMHLDSGASSSSLSAHFARAHPQVLKGLAVTRQRLAGAGGSSERAVAQWPQVTVQIGGQRAMLPSLAVTLQDPTEVSVRNQGVLGWDVLAAFPAWTLDFDHMRLELEGISTREAATSVTTPL
ncbi:retropepsin-like aspartic protease family protein [Stenotrophomonas indicatrix]|uniref:retropepsin-like aspartic protease family protein n=1 Tax=Stenotrophomonas indicatrix TaxID=2045451 RepID=UPI001CBB3EBF|nr:retropepsin-like aspartic protease [Stenotrophomonas indicatrix]